MLFKEYTDGSRKATFTVEQHLTVDQIAQAIYRQFRTYGEWPKPSVRPITRCVHAELRDNGYPVVEELEDEKPEDRAYALRLARMLDNRSHQEQEQDDGTD